MANEANKTKLSISMSPTLARFIERYQQEKALSTRSEAVEQMIYWFYTRYQEARYYQLGLEAEELAEQERYEGAAGENMAVVRIRQFKSFDKRLVTTDQGTDVDAIDQVSSALEPRTTEVRAVLEQGSYPFFMNVGTYPRTVRPVGG